VSEKIKALQSYFPTIEQKYGKPVKDWFRVLDGHKELAHMEMVAILKDRHGLGHGHANALVAYYRANTSSD